MAASGKRQIKDWIKLAESKGWRVVQGKGHIKFYPADKSKDMTVVPSTPGGGNRAIDNARAALKRAGLFEEDTK